MIIPDAALEIQRTIILGFTLVGSFLAIGGLVLIWWTIQDKEEGKR